MATLSVLNLLDSMRQHHAIRAMIVDNGTGHLETESGGRLPLRIDPQQAKAIIASVNDLGEASSGGWLVRAPERTWRATVLEEEGHQTMRLEPAQDSPFAMRLPETPRPAEPVPATTAPTMSAPAMSAPAMTAPVASAPVAAAPVAPPVLPHPAQTYQSTPTPTYAPAQQPARAYAEPMHFQGLPADADPKLVRGAKTPLWTMLVGFTIGAVLTLLFGLIFPRTSMLGRVFNLRSVEIIIPALIMAGFFWGLLICVYRAMRLGGLAKYDPVDPVGQSVAMLRQGGLAGLATTLQVYERPVSASPALRRVQAVVSQWLLAPGLDEADILLAQHARREEREHEVAWGLPRTIIWALPVLGLIGTVIGISFAVAGFATFLGSDIADVDLIKQNLVGVTGGLSFAFLITLLGLATSLLLMLFASSLQSRERRHLTDLDHDLVDRFLPVLQEIAPVKHATEATKSTFQDDKWAQTIGRQLIEVHRDTATQWKDVLQSAGGEVMNSLRRSIDALTQQLDSRFEQRTEVLGASIKDQLDAAQKHAEVVAQLAKSTESASQLVQSMQGSLSSLTDGHMPQALDRARSVMQEHAQSLDRSAKAIEQLTQQAQALMQAQQSLHAATQQLERTNLSGTMSSVREAITAIMPALAAFRQPMMLQLAPATHTPTAHAPTQPHTDGHALAAVDGN